jgi:predicted HTH transcriptional regulator
MIGEYISALANAATLHDMQKAYLIYGIEDETLDLIGTKFKPKITKKGNEELENWLHRLLEPNIDFTIYEFECQGKDVSIFEIDCATHSPISFQGKEYIRVGSYKKSLKDYPQKERNPKGSGNNCYSGSG